MKKNHISRRRGTTIAAAALSFALVAPFAQAVAPASPYAAVANAQQDQPAAEAPTSGSDNAIYSPGQADQKSTISGSVKEIVEAKVGFGNVQASGKALKGVKIYAQWYEGENTQHSSPVYYTESDENGNFTIKMAPYTDALGATRFFDADASVGLTTGPDRGKRDHKREKIRVWTELPENLTDKYRLVHQPAAGIFPRANTTPTTQGDAQWGGNKITGMTIQYAQKDKLPQHLPESKRVESTGTGGNGGTLGGRAYWNLDVLQGALNHNTVNAFGGKDIPGAGLKVVGSYLTDDAVNKIEAYAKDNFAGKTLRGRGWTPADEAGLQKWINEQIAADPEGWIAETLTTTTGADGKFELRFKGIWGSSRTYRGIVPEDKFGKLAGSHEEGVWTRGALNSKHLNLHWSYVSILDKDGNPLPDNIGALYPWSLGQWAGPGFGAGLNAGGGAHYFGGDSAFIGETTDGYTGWNIALAPQALKFDVVDKNTTDNWATIGDTVTTDTSGLPLSEDLNYYIEWVDKNGKVVKTCETAKADSATKIPECELDVPTDAQTGDTFTARLKVTEGNPDPANDLVLAMDAFAVTRDYLEYDPVDAKKREEATSEPKFDNPASEDVEEKKPDNASFELGKLPEGVAENQVKVDPATGVVTFTPTAEQAGKTFTFPVVMRDEALQVPALDENGDPVLDEAGKPTTQARIVARADAVFNVEADKQNTLVEPKYEDKLVVPGKETKSSPTFTDKEGKDATVPEGSGFKISDGLEAPEGYEVEIDETTGEITVTYPDKSKLNKDTVEEFDVPVTVTYPDGSTDEAPAKFQLDTDGDGEPDVTDPDDDGDGIPDEDDSNPKAPNAAENLEPGYKDGSGKPGSDVKIGAPEFKDKNGEGKAVDAPEGTKFTPGENVPDGVTVDENTGEITVKVPEDANPGDKITVPVEVTYPDGSKDNVDVTVTVEEPDAPEQPDVKTADEIDPEYKGGNGKPGEDVKVDAPDFKDKDGNPTEAPEGTTFTPGEDAPDGVTVDENTGEITVKVPEDANPGDKITVPVEVTYPDGSKDNVDVTVTVENPDAKNNETFEPEYGDGSGEPGEDVKVPAPEFKDKDGNPTTAPDGTTFTPGEDAPDGVTVDENTGEITVKVPEDANPGDKITVPVEVTYPDGSKDNVDVTVTVEEPDAPEQPDVKTADEIDPEYKGGNGKPGEDVKVDAPDFKDKDGNPTEAPEGTTFTPGEDAPDGVTVDENTGEITVKVPEDANPGDKITVPVEVTYPDGSKDNVDVTVTVEEPDAPEQPDVKTADEIDPEYKGGNGKPGEDVKVDAPDFKDKDGNPTEAPEGTTFTPGEDAPDGVTVDENTGEITVKVPEDANPGDKITVPVEVTYPDGSKDNVDVTVTVENPDAKNNETFEPEYGDGSGEPGEDVKVPAPEFKDKDGNPTTAPDGTTFTPGEDAPDGVTVDENTGEITVKVPEDANPGDKITVPVEVTYPDGSKDNVDVTVTVEDPDAPEVKPGDTTVPADGKDHTVGKVENPKGDETGNLVDKDGNQIPGSKVEIDEDGNIKVTVPEGTDPQDATVVVTDKDGNKVGDFEVKIIDEETPNYGDAVLVKPGESEPSKKPFGEKDVPAGTTINVNEPKDATGWKFKGDEETGVITGQAPSYEELAKQFAELGEKDWNKVVEALTPVAEPNVDVEFEYADKSKDRADAKFQLVGQDGKSILDPEGDADGDGVSNREEVEKGSNPFDKNSTPKDNAPAPQPGPADPGKCMATAVGFGLPLLALIPIGLATQLTIPGLTDFVENVSMDIERANAQIQKNLGMFNPETAQAMSQMNAQLRKAGLDLATVGAGLAVIAAGILAGTLLYENCAPGDAKSSIKVDSLKGSSGNTWTSSKKDEK